MNAKRMSETAINASIDACLHAAREGDADEGRHLHELLDHMLSERETPDGKLWLTDHGRMLLAEMHRRLSHAEGGGEHLKESVLDAVQLSPRQGHWQDNCSFVRDLRVAISVANELCEQRGAGREPDLDRAATAVAGRGDFELSSSRIREVYEEIASSVGGFREISAC
jgi:hypothetical protein